MEGTAAFEFYDTGQAPSDLPERTLSTCGEFELSTRENTLLSPTDEKFSWDSPREVYWNPDNRASATQVRLRFNENHDSGIDSILSVSTSASYLQCSTDEQEGGSYSAFTRTLLQLIRRLAVEFDPAYVTSYSSGQIHHGPSMTEVLPEETPIELGHLPWFGIYGEQLLDQFGGRERVLQTPSWRVEELETGSVLIIKTREPWENYGRDQPADRYLLDGEG